MDNGGPLRNSRLDKKKVTMRTKDSTHGMVHHPFFIEVVKQGNTDMACTGLSP